MSQLRALRPIWGALRNLVLGSLLITGAQPGGWQVGVVEGGTGGKFSSLRIDKYGNAHVAYFDASQGLLQYGFWDHNLNKWFTTTLDRTTGYCSLALDSRQYPHISYPQYGPAALKHTYWDGTAWQKQTVDVPARVINYYTSIALDSKDNLSISFYEELGLGDDQLRLRMVTWNGQSWELRTVDSDQGSGKFNSIAIDSAGHPHILYGNVEYKNASLRYARWNGRAWEIEILEGAGKPGTSMWSVALVLDKKDIPHIAYSDVKNGIVKYGTKVGGNWQLQAVDSVDKVGYPDRNGLALDEKGNPYVSYFDAGRGLLKMAFRKNGKWVVEVIDRGFAGFQNSLQVHNDMVWVAYASDTGNELKCAKRPVEDLTQASQMPSGGKQR